MHINDWAAIQTLFDKLNKQLERTQKVTQSLGVPRAYVRMMCELEDFLAKTLAGAWWRREHSGQQPPQLQLRPPSCRQPRRPRGLQAAGACT